VNAGARMSILSGASAQLSYTDCILQMRYIFTGFKVRPYMLFFPTVYIDLRYALVICRMR